MGNKFGASQSCHITGTLEVAPYAPFGDYHLAIPYVGVADDTFLISPTFLTLLLRPPSVSSSIRVNSLWGKRQILRQLQI